MTYILEYAKSDRSSCSGPKKECPSADRTIGKGELRLGVEVPRAHGVTWRHWTCTTPTVIENMHKALSKPEKIEGFEELLSEDQERVVRAWNEGQIPENEKPEPYLQQEEDENEIKTEHDDEDMKKEEVYELEEDEIGVEEEGDKEEYKKGKGKMKENGSPKEELPKEELPKEESSTEEELHKKEEATDEGPAEEEEHSNEPANEEEESKAKTTKRCQDEIKQKDTNMDKKRAKRAIAVPSPSKIVVPKVSRFKGRGRRASTRVLRSPSTRHAMNAKASSSAAQEQGTRANSISSQDVTKAPTRRSSARKRTGVGYTTGKIKKRVKRE